MSVSAPKPVAFAAVRPLFGMVASFRDTSLDVGSDVEEIACILLPAHPHTHFPEFHSVGDEQKGYLYPDHNQNDCGALTPACEQFFIEEGCFYECDKNLGKWRKHDDCSQDEANDNGWEVEGVPIKASYCDRWYEACRGADNKLCTGAASEPGAPVYSYFGQPECHETEGRDGCRRIDEVYTSGKHMCETMWGTAFKYEDDTSKDAYVMSFTEGQTNPNNAMFASKAYPKRCSGDLGHVNLTKAGEDGCPADWHTSADSYTELHTVDTLQCDDGDCTPQSESAACVSATAVGAGIAAAAAALLA